LALPNRLRNLRPVMINGIAPAYNKMLHRHWTSQGAAFGQRWAPLAPRTIETRARKGTLHKGILRDTDHLFKAVFRARATDDRLKMIKGGIRFQGNVGEHKAIYHHLGTFHMPERKVIPDPLPRSFKQQVRAIVREYALTGRVPRA
jgi:hypothetical protein